MQGAELYPYNSTQLTSKLLVLKEFILIAIYVFLGECVWLDSAMKLMQRVIENCKETFPVTAYGFTLDPTCTTGQIGFVLVSNDKVI